MSNKRKLTRMRKVYSAQFKEQTLQRTLKDGVPKAAQDLGLAESLIYSWRACERQMGTPFEEQKLQQGELSRLKREVDRLSMENSFLKKAAAYFAKETK